MSGSITLNPGDTYFSFFRELFNNSHFYQKYFFSLTLVCKISTLSFNKDKSYHKTQVNGFNRSFYIELMFLIKHNTLTINIFDSEWFGACN